MDTYCQSQWHQKELHDFDKIPSPSSHECYFSHAVSRVSGRICTCGSACTHIELVHPETPGDAFIPIVQSIMCILVFLSLGGGLSIVLKDPL